MEKRRRQDEEERKTPVVNCGPSSWAPTIRSKSSVKSIIYVVMITSHVYVAYLNFYAFVTSIFTRART